MRPILSTTNWLETAGTTLSATSEASGLGIANVLTPQLGEVWRSASNGVITIRADLQAVRDIGMIALGMPRTGLLPVQHDTVRIMLSATTVDGTDVLDTGEISADAPYGTWCYPLAAGVRPNRVANHSLRDGTSGWTAFSTSGTGTVQQLPPALALKGVGGGQIAQTGNLTTGFLGAANTAVTAAVGQIWCARASAAVASCLAQVRLFALNGGGTVVGSAAASLSQAPGAAFAYRDSWRRSGLVTLTAPANTATVYADLVGEPASPAGFALIGFAEVQLYRGEQLGADVPFAGHLIPAPFGRLATEAQTAARYVTIQLRVAGSYAQLGRIWVGPAWTPRLSHEPGAEADDVGARLRAPLTGQGFNEPGAVLRRLACTTPLLDRDEAERLAALAVGAGGTRQVVFCRSVETAVRESAFGTFSRLPVPIRRTPMHWTAAMEVQEDQ